MKDTTALEVKRPIKWYNKKVKTNFVKVFQALAKSAVMGLSGNEYSSAKEAIGITDAFSLQDDPNGLAYLLILTAMINASNDLIEENKFRFKKLEQNEKLYEDDDFVSFLNQMNDVLESQELTIHKDFFSHPKNIAILEPYCEHFKSSIIHFGLDEVEANNITLRLPSYFVLALHEEWSSNSSTYDSIINSIDTPFEKAATRELEWDHYFTFLEKQAQEAVFDETFSLQQIYVPLRAYYFERSEATPDKQLANKNVGKNPPKIALWLEEYLNDWLINDDHRDAIKVISGGPGSGKSTFAKIWASKLAAGRKCNLLFIPLHLINVSGDLINAIGKFINQFVDIKLSYNPLEEIQQEKSLLIIFDGLDELSQQGKFSQEVANDFIREIERQQSLCNRKNQVKLKVLITGREVTVQGNANQFRKEGQIIHLLPYLIEKDAKDKFKEKYDLLSIDQRDEWWKNYSSLSGLNYEGLPPELSNTNINEITAQPLLNYLVALSVKRGKIQFSEHTSLNLIYQDLIEGVHERAYEGRKHLAVGTLAKEDFFRVLEEIALSAWHGGDVRTTTVKKIENHITSSGLTRLLENFQENAKSGITRLLTAFYFRQHSIQEGDRTFEFTHKSFGEYLTARRLVKLIRTIHKNLQAKQEDIDSGWSQKEALSKWLVATGPTSVDEYLYRFLEAEMSVIGKTALESLQDQITSLLNLVMEKGIPFNEDRKSNKEENRLSRNAEEALLVMLHLCIKITRKNVKIHFSNPHDFGAWVSKLQPQRIDGNNVISYKCFEGLILHKASLIMSDLYKVNFKNAILNHVLFFNANLSWANLSWANLSWANLGQADLSQANLRQANLTEANLTEANLTEANLSRANLWQANLGQADLSQANLSRANLGQANLGQADLWQADLWQADLRQADLRQANLSRANLGQADLRQADLREANLGQANLGQADLREADLRQANLGQADLREANLGQANLGQADLRQADLREANLGQANLGQADLREANLGQANLGQADLREADLREVKNLTYVQLLSTANLKGAKGINKEWKEKLLKEKPSLFE